MRRKIQLIASVLVTLAGMVCAQTTQESSISTEQIRREAMKEIDGRDLIARVYPDPANAPDQFALVSVPISGHAVNFSGIRDAYPSITESAYVLMQASDQSDDTVATLLGRWVYLYPFTPERIHSQWIRQGHKDYEPVWTFFDALGNPIAGAKVELVMRWDTNGRGAPIRISIGTTDDEGQIPRFHTFSSKMMVRLEHPDYDTATIRTFRHDIDQTGILVVPLTPKPVDSSAWSIQGTVVDSNGHAVADMPVLVERIPLSTDSNDCYARLFEGGVTTDEQGRFTLCVPGLSEDLMLRERPDPGTPRLLRVEPPTSSHLRRLVKFAHVGVDTTLTVTAMKADEAFHTFAFEYYDGPVTDLEELANITLSLERDGRQWCTLTYDQFIGGCTLPLGILRAKTIRWGRPLEFAGFVLNANSPEHLVFTTGPVILYQGRVVESGTNRPLSGVFVVADHSLLNTAPSELTAEQWQELARQAEVDGTSAETLYQQRDRVAATDQDGVFEFLLASQGGTDGISETRLFNFTALAPGYAAPPRVQAHLNPDFQVMEVPTLELCRPGEVYFPQLVFEDENGSITDPNRLDEISLIISSDRWTRATRVTTFLEKREFIAGTYSAQVTRNGKRYLFNSVDLTTARPDVVVFKPISTEPSNLNADVIYRGLVVDEATGKPISGAVVACCDSPAPPQIKDLRPEEWKAIRALGAHPNLKNPAFAPFWTFATVDRYTGQACIGVTDENGKFELHVSRFHGGGMEFVYILAQDYSASLKMLMTESGTRGGLREDNIPSLQSNPNEDNATVLPTFSLTPAGTS